MRRNGGFRARFPILDGRAEFWVSRIGFALVLLPSDENVAEWFLEPHESQVDDRPVVRGLRLLFSERMAQNHEDLQHRVISTDTASRSGPEGKEGEGRAQLLVRFGETLRIEILRISASNAEHGAHRTHTQ